MDKVICTYDDYLIIERYNGKQYFICFDDMEVKKVEQVAAIAVTNQSDIELMDNGNVPKYDVSGELDTERTYCYWRIIDTK